MKTTAEMIEVMQAFYDGGAIEIHIFGRPSDDWAISPSPSWNWEEYSYRIKPEPVECWLIITGSGTRSIYDSHCEAKRVLDGLNRTHAVDKPYRIAKMQEVTED